MYQVSEALDKVISGSGRTFYARLNEISDGIQEIVQTNFSTPDSYFYVGGAIASKIEVSMFTKSQKFVKGTEVRFEIGATADGTIEWIPMGYFTIKEQKKDRNLLTFTAYDRFESKLAKTYKSKIVKYPVESKEFLTDISEQTGVEFDTSKLSDSLMIDKILTVNDQSGEKTYKEPFDGFTMQQVVGYIAQLHGTFAICDRNGKVTFRWYEALTTDYPGKIGDTAGSYLKDQNLSFIYNTIEFLKESHTYLIKTNRYFDDLLQSETMCQISGISCDTENNHYESGTNINTNLSNPVMTQEWLNKILKKIKDMSYYPVSFSFMGDPRLDVGDVVTIVDAKNNLIDVPVMQHTITFDGGLLSEVSSYGFEEKEVKSPSEIALQRIKDDILSLQEITAKKATFNQLNAVDAKITNLQASTITVNDANILFARLDKANIQQGWITNVMIGDAQITNAKIQGMSADKLTAGTIDASIITVKNLDADSITVGKINWKQLSDDVNTTITDSKNTANNALNAANSSVQNVIIEYYSSTSKDQPVNGMWQTDSPDWVEGRYVWCRTKTVTKSGVISYSDASCITGNTGAQGDRGIPGINGENGQTSYLHIAYANSADGTSGFSTNDSTNKLYIGQYIDFIEADSTLPSAYQWTKIKGDTGAKGEDGVSPIASVTKSGNVTTITITDKNGTHTQKVTDGTNGTPGASGADGRTSYFHAKYSNDGGKTFTANNGEATGDWIGTYTDFTEADSMSVVAYTWVKIKGDKGDQGVQGAQGKDGKTYYTWIKYADSATSGMSDNPTGKKYIGFAYNKSTATESTNYSDYAWSLIKGDTGSQGVKGDTGATGNGIKSITYYYAKTTTQTAPSANSITATTMPQIDSTNKYLWQKEVITYTNSQTQTSVLLLAVYGNTGAKGDKGDQGVQGAQGKDGKTYYTWIKYADSATSGMSDNPTGKKYIGFAYNKSTATESTNYSDYAWSLIKGDTGSQGVKGDTGATGNGIKSITYYYAKTTTQTAPSANSITATTMPQIDSTNKYLWQKEVITYTNSQTQTSVLLLAVYGNTGAKGDKGDQGVQGKGIKSIKGQYYLSSSKISLVGGTWSDTQPTWTEGSYIWTRSYIIWSDDTITTTTPILANALNTANSVANTALSTADGKNTVFYQPNQPSATGRKTNDVWYDTGNENAMYYFDGKSWVKKVFGNNALDNISASKITTGILDAEKVTLINLDAGSITTGTITGLDAIFNRSFTVNSPYSDTQSFIIEANQNNIIIGTRIKDVLYSTNDNSIIFSPTGVTLQGGNGAVVITAKHDVTIGSDGGSIYLNANGTTYNDIPIYARNDLYTFKILHEGNTTLKSEFSSGVEIGSISLGTLSMTLKVPLASTTQSGLITASEKSKLNTDYLPLTGGTLESSNVNVLGLNCTSGMMSTLRFYGSGKRLGSVGFNAQNSSLYRWNTSGTAYRILDENDLPLMTDSGWVNITLGSGITAVSYIGARVRKIGNIVNVVMGITGATAAFQTLGTLAQGYRPSKEINLAARYYNSPTTAIAIGTDGAIKLLQTASGGSSYNASGAISFSITYFI